MSIHAFRDRGTMLAVAPLALVLAGGMLCLPPEGNGQAAGVNQGGSPYIHSPAGMDPFPERGGLGETAQVEKMRQAARQQRLASDTAKLVQLSAELKTEVEQSPKDQLSVDALRKADQIEKLAHDVKSWMKD